VQVDYGTGDTARQWYHPYGVVRATAGGGVDATERSFTGQTADPTGLLFYQARYYDPTVRRFVSPDTVVPDPANPQHFDRYSYVTNNPINYSDPSGHDPCAGGGGGCGGVRWGDSDGDGIVCLMSCEKHRSIPPEYQPYLYGGSVDSLGGVVHGALAPLRFWEWAPALGGTLVDYGSALATWDLARIEAYDRVAMGLPAELARIALKGNANERAELVGGLAFGGVFTRLIRKFATARNLATNPAGRPLWGFWDDYPKVTVNGTEYADVGGRLYTQHAVDRMIPRGFGGGRSISPTYVEEVLTSDLTVVKPVTGPLGQPRLSYVNGSVEVITENDIVVTIITR
jgi:RHS repeat-associated protein